MAAAKTRTDKAVNAIKKLLEKDYCSLHPKAKVEVYRYNSASVRIRIIDPDFAGKSYVDRDDAIWRILERLPEEIFADISLILLFTPQEAKTELMNMEFDDPTPSTL